MISKGLLSLSALTSDSRGCSVLCLLSEHPLRPVNKHEVSEILHSPHYVCK